MSSPTSSSPREIGGNRPRRGSNSRPASCQVSTQSSHGFVAKVGPPTTPRARTKQHPAFNSQPPARLSFDDSALPSPSSSPNSASSAAAAAIKVVDKGENGSGDQQTTTWRSTSSASLKYRKSVSEDDGSWDEFYPFNEDENESNILFTEDSVNSSLPVIKGGSLPKLVQRLTIDEYPDTDYLAAFLLTYRTFTTPPELLDLLTARFNMPRPKSPTKQQLEEFETKRNRVRLRVFNVLKTWVSNHFYDFAEDSNLLEVLTDFIAHMELSGMETASTHLRNIIERKQNELKESKSYNKMFSKEPPEPILPSGCTMNSTSPSNNQPLIDLNWDPLEVARQLTLIEYNLYKSIKPQECLNQAWTKKATRDTNAANIMAMITRFNAVSRWVATEIVKAESLKLRIDTLTMFIQIAMGCKSLNNYNGMMEIISGLQSSSIFRLKNTWGGLSGKLNKAYEDIKELMSRHNNYKVFREHLHNVDPPCIPYLGVYLTDLTFIEDGNKDYLAGGLINFVKRRAVSEVISEIQQYQQTPYCLKEVPFMANYLKNVEFWEENETYNNSLKVEPKSEQTPGKTKVKSSAFSSSKLSTFKRKDTKKIKAATPEKEKQPSTEEYRPYEEPDWGELEPMEGYRFNQPDSKEYLVLDVDFSGMGLKDTRPMIKAATLEKLIEHMTHQHWPDSGLANTFLMTYTTFTTRVEVMQLLIMRFNMPKPKSPTLQEKYLKEKVIPVRLRVFNVCKNWIDKNFYGCAEDKEFISKFEELASIMQKNGMEQAGQSLHQSLQRRLAGDEKVRERHAAQESAPKPHIPKYVTDLKKAVLTDFHSEEFARQLTIMEQNLFLRIEAWELLPQACLSSDRHKDAPNVHALLQHAERMQQLVASEVVSQTTPEQCCLYVSHWIKVAERCLGLNNFNSMVEIVMGLNLLDLPKLKAIWSALAPFTKNTYNKLMTMTNGKQLEDKMHNVQPPILPYIGSFVQSLQELSKLKDNTGNLINFEKRTLIAGIQMEVYQHQQSRYTLEVVPLIQEWISSAPVLELGDIQSRTRNLQAKTKKKTKKKTEKRKKSAENESPSPYIRELSHSVNALPTDSARKMSKLLGVSVEELGGSSPQAASTPPPTVHRKATKLLGIDPDQMAAMQAAQKKSKGSTVSAGGKRKITPPSVPGASTVRGIPDQRKKRSSLLRSQSSSRIGSPLESSGEFTLDQFSSPPASRASRGGRESASGSMHDQESLGLDTAKFQLLGMFLDDAEFRQEVTELLLEEGIQMSLAAASASANDKPCTIRQLTTELDSFKEKLKLALTDVSKQGGSGDTKEWVAKHASSICSALKASVQESSLPHPRELGLYLKQWQKEDANGHVFGWKDNISALMLHSKVSQEPPLAILDVRSSVNKSDVATLLRTASFYQTSERTSAQPNVCVLCNFVSDDAKDIASRYKNLFIINMI
ncbi:Son of sevenless 1 [Balamuthia mandrillaris]